MSIRGGSLFALWLRRGRSVLYASLFVTAQLFAQPADSVKVDSPQADSLSVEETVQSAIPDAAQDSAKTAVVSLNPPQKIPDTLPWAKYVAGEIDLAANGWREAHVPAGFLPDLERIRPRVGLALSGGGARGLAHIGVLQVLEEEGVPIDRIVGTSMGAILGGLYAAGYSAQSLQDIAEKLDWSGLFSDTPSRRNMLLGQKELSNQEMVKLRFRGGQAYIPDALVTGQTLYLEIQRHVDRAPFAPSGTPFEDMQVPLGVMATDLNRGARVLIDDGDLTLALRATMALPVVFRALRFRGQLLVDGGAIENIPVRGALDLGSEVVLAVDCSSPVVPDLDPDLPWDIANQVTTLMSAPNDTVSRQLADLMIRPKLNGYTSTDFIEVQDLIKRGRETAEAMIPEILAKTGRGNHAPELMVNLAGVEIVTDAPMEERLNPEAYGLREGEYTTRQINRRLDAIISDLHTRGFAASTLAARIKQDGVLRVDVSLGVLHEVRVEGVSPKHLNRVLREINLRIGEPVHSEALQSSIVQLYATGRYSTVFRFFERDEQGRLVLTFLLERAPLPRLGFGMGFDSDRRSRYFADFVLPHPFPTIGEELLVRARYGEQDELYGIYHRADRLGRTYIGWRASLEYLERQQIVRTIYDGSEIRSAMVYTGRAELGALFNLRNWGGFSLGVLTERVADDLSGDDRRMVYNGLVARGTIDTEDRKPFPSRGVRIVGEYRSYLPEIGEEGFNVLDIKAEVVTPLSPRLFLRIFSNTSVADLTTPTTHRISLGGLDQFPAVEAYRFLSFTQLHNMAELRYDLVSKVIAETYLLFRYDVAGFSDQKDWRPVRSDLVQSFSFGIALDTFLGPFEVWSAYMPRSETAEEQTRIGVNLGYRF